MLALAMTRHELEVGQTKLSCAIDQRHELIVPDWILHEVEDEGVDPGVSPVELLQRKTGWVSLPGFPPKDQPPPEFPGSGEWELDCIKEDE